MSGGARRRARALHAEKTAARISVDIERLERFVTRFRYKKSKAKQAQAKLTQIGRLEQERKGATDEHALLTRSTRRLGFDFARAATERPRRARGERRRRQRGRQGALARRLLRARARRARRARRPERKRQDDAARGDRCAESHKLGTASTLGYFPQHEVHLDDRGSVLDCVNRMTGLTRPKAQTLLGRFLFSGWEAHEKPVTALSGGERRRLALAVLVASGANFLMLDEPTNHLDLESREALEEALEAFPGTVLLVSHDRALLDAVAHRTLAIEDGTIRTYDGGWADYLQARDAARRGAASSPAAGAHRRGAEAAAADTASDEERPRSAGPDRGADRGAGAARRRAGGKARRRLVRRGHRLRPTAGPGRSCRRSWRAGRSCSKFLRSS